MKVLVSILLAMLSASVSAQDSNCQVHGYRMAVLTDPMTDVTRCLIQPNGRGEGHLQAVVDPKLGLLIGVSGEKYPGQERVGVRADKLAPHYGEPFISGAAALDLLAEVRAASHVSTTYTDWPYEAPRGGTYPVCNFVDIVDHCLASVK